MQSSILTAKQRIYISCFKRPIGFLGALIALLILSPIFVLTIIILLIINKNGWKGVFFVQERPGKDEKIFKALKFKTMADQCDEEGNLLPDSERLTRVGRFIRSTSIDELPQLINILKGDMAFIGPRPLLVQYLPLYSDEQRHRHDVIPGMSGWAQVNGRNNISWTKKFELDVYYVQHIGPMIDLKIFFMTIKKVLFREDVNTTTGQSATMDYFNGNN